MSKDKDPAVVYTYPRRIISGTQKSNKQWIWATRIFISGRNLYPPPIYPCQTGRYCIHIYNIFIYIILFFFIYFCRVPRGPAVSVSIFLESQCPCPCYTDCYLYQVINFQIISTVVSVTFQQDS